MTKLRKVGFYSELEDEDASTGKIAGSEGMLKANSEQISNYLETGIQLLVCPGLSVDVLDKNKNIIGTMGVKTDGVWAWPSYLPYYVDRYQVGLPEEFLEHIKKTKNIPSEIDVSNLQF